MTVVEGDSGVVIVPEPWIKVQVPTAGAVAVLPARVALLAGRQSCWSGPAFAAAWEGLKLVMVTFSSAGTLIF